MAPKLAKAKAKANVAKAKATAKGAPSSAKIKGRPGAREVPAAAVMQPDVLARLPFQTLSFKLQGQMPVMEIHSLVSKGITTRAFRPFGAPAVAMPPMPLEDQRRNTQQTVDEAIERVQGWRDRAALMQCLNSVVPMESNLGICKGNVSDMLKTCHCGRILTTILYLNPGWQDSDGGSIRLFEVDPPLQVRGELLPFGNRLLAFWADEVPHEVLPPRKDRFACTFWYLDRDVDPSSVGFEKAPATKAAAAAGSVFLD
eukprot:Skav224110  [mRNA]  locus=scaffold2427:47497:58242:+ [translate_table: standard]